MSTDASRELLESLPELPNGKTFCFDCNPEVPCFNRCCAELTLPLTPYDVLRLCRHLGMGSEAFLGTFATMRSFPDTGFPLPMLRMLDGPDELCPFVTPAGCAVYDDRPGACRFYPLGRGTKIASEGVAERFFVVREDHCRGFDTGTERTAAQWLAHQELQPFNASNDKYMRLMSLVRATGSPLEPRMTTMCVLALFQMDKFRQFLTAMRVCDRLDLSAERRQAAMEDSLHGDQALLDFGLDWMELIIFGQSQGLAPKAD